jgi:hypothetical protein
MTQGTQEWQVVVKNSVYCQFRQNWALFSIWVAASLSSLIEVKNHHQVVTLLVFYKACYLKTLSVAKIM